MKKPSGKNASRGMITVEACISVMLFMVLMLLILGLFQMFMAQNVTAHTLLQTTESLSLDTYATSKIKSDSWTDSLGTQLASFITSLFGTADENPNFVTDSAWYSGKGPQSFGEVLKTRFVGYLANGDEGEADRFLKAVNVVDGLAGLDFSQSKIVNGDLHVVLQYELEYSFRIWGLETVAVNQTAVSRLWIDNADAKNLNFN